MVGEFCFPLAPNENLKVQWQVNKKRDKCFNHYLPCVQQLQESGSIWLNLQPQVLVADVVCHRGEITGMAFSAASFLFCLVIRKYFLDRNLLLLCIAF